MRSRRPEEERGEAGPRLEAPARQRRWVAAVSVALSLLAALASSGEVLEGVERQHAGCVERVEASREASPAACEPSWLVVLPSWTPWTRAEAVGFRREAALRIGGLRLGRAALERAEAGERDALAREVLALEDGPTLDAATLALGAGAREVVVEEARAEGVPGRQRAALAACGQLGAEEPGLQLAAQASGAPEVRLQAGALLCLAGRRAEGLEHLRAASAAYAQEVGGEAAWPEVELAEAACGAPPEAGARAGGEQAAALRGQGEAWAGGSARRSPTWRLAAAAARLGAPEARPGSIGQLVALLAPEGLGASGLQGAEVLLLGPGSLHAPQAALPLPPLPLEVLQRAAERLAGLSGVSSGASLEERAVLRSAAARLELWAARASARLGRRDDAVRHAERAAEREPVLAPDAALALLAADAPQDALRLLRAEPLPSEPPLRRALALTLALIDTGALDAAFDAATDGLRRAPRGDAPAPETLALTWLWAALQRTTQRPVPTDLHLTPSGRAEDPLTWARLAAEADDAPGDARRRLPLLAEAAPPDALHAAMLLAATLTPEGGDPEVLLDHVFALQAAVRPRAWRRARARAAAWRGDDASAARWREADARARRRVRTVADATLADYAGW